MSRIFQLKLVGLVFCVYWPLATPDSKKLLAGRTLFDYPASWQLQDATNGDAAVDLDQGRQ